ncbi:MAG: hypothetical protein WC180_00920 [Candidatus Paceibacterota bacterium]
MIPKIEFCNSRIYDEKWREYFTALKKEYPPYKTLAGKIKKIEKAWEKDGEKILREIEKSSGLKWQEKKIQCFVVGRSIAFSYPLTIMVYDDYPIDYVVDVLTHELIHQIFIQNGKQGELYKAWTYFYRKYKAEEESTIIHIPVHAIHYQVFMKLFDENRLRREIDYAKKYPDYKRAWEIVMEKGAENIIEEFRKRVA